MLGGEVRMRCATGGLWVTEIVLVLVCLHLRGSACLDGLVGATSRVVVQSWYHGVLVAIVVLERIQILTVEGPLRLCHLPRPFQAHLGLLLSVELFLVFPLLF